MMGEIAARLADRVIVTTDDPHSEEPQAIINGIIKGAKGLGDQGTKVIEEVDRKTAITKALKMAGKGDIVLIAGRGHEKYQDFGNKQVPFDDKEVVRELLKG